MSCYDLVHAEDFLGRHRWITLYPFIIWTAVGKLSCWQTTDDVDDAVKRCFFVYSPHRSLTQSATLLLHSALDTKRYPLCIIGYLACIPASEVGQMDVNGNLSLQLAAQIKL